MSKTSTKSDSCRADPIARPLALARDTARFAKYLLSHSFLTNQITEAQYREAMPGVEG